MGRLLFHLIHLLSCLLLLPSCLSVSNLHSARPIKKDERQASLAFGFTSILLLEEREESYKNLQSLRLPFLEVGARYGLSSSFDLGAKWTIPGTYGLDSRINLINESDWALSTGAGFYYAHLDFLIPDTHYTIKEGSLPIYLTYDIDQEISLHHSWRYLYRMSDVVQLSAFKSNHHEANHYLIANFGVSWRFLVAEAAFIKHPSRKDLLFQGIVGFVMGWDRISRK